MRDRLYGLMRYCSARRIGPPSVDDTIFDEFWRYRAETTARTSNNTARRFMVWAWNASTAAIDDWPLRRLIEPPIKKTEPAWDDFPAGLRVGLDDYFAGLAKVHRSLGGKRIQPCSPTTIATRRAELVAMARMAVRLGAPIENLSSLGALLHPDIAERVIDAYWQKNGQEPKTGTIDLGWKLLRMARETGSLDQAALERLDEMRAALEEHRREGLTPKNLKLIRQVLSDGVWTEVISLPNVLMQQARSSERTKPLLQRKNSDLPLNRPTGGGIGQPTRRASPATNSFHLSTRMKPEARWEEGARPLRISSRLSAGTRHHSVWPGGRAMSSGL
jgi:hypothetical protein